MTSDWQIQITKTRRFENVLIMPGSFHLFKTIGKLIAESGGPEMLTESEVLVPEWLFVMKNIQPMQEVTSHSFVRL